MTQRQRHGEKAHRRSPEGDAPAALSLKPLSAGIRLACVPAGLILVLGLNPAFANGPQGGQVVGGQGNINKPDSNTTNIHQQSHRMVIDWTSFNVPKEHTVNFNQPSSSASALNRIYDQNPSQIYGTINANGQVLLVNPNGVFFSPTASVNVNSLVASGLDIRAEDFMAGRYEFFARDGESGGAVINQGVLQAANGGSINLIGGSVSNEGLIIASAGQVNLVAGDKITMDFDGDGLMRFTVDKEVLENAMALDSAVSNTGEIHADGGMVLMSGRVAQDVFTHVVNNEGLVRAGRIENEGGTIRLVGSGGSQSSVINTGTLDASADDHVSDGGTVEIIADTIDHQGVIRADSTGGDGGTVKLIAEDTNIISGDAVISATSIPSPSMGEGQDGGDLNGEGDSNESSSPGSHENASTAGKGGTVHVLGDKVALLDNSMIDVSGEFGGGQVLVGGDFQGKNPDIQNASMTYVDKDVAIKADAITNGDGGEVIVWADEATRFYGSISATGGSEGGDGGFAEVSGKQYLDFRGHVDLTAVVGDIGTLLLDPQDIRICAEAVGTCEIEDIGGGPGGPFTPGSDTSILFVATLEAALAGADVLVTTDGSTGPNNGDITVEDAVTWVANNTLTLEALGSIFVNAEITGGGGLTLEADQTINIAAPITLASGSFLAEAGSNIVVTGNITTNNGNITMTADGIGAGAVHGIDINGATLDADGGNIDLNGIGGAGTGDLMGVYVRNGANILTTGTGTIAIDGTGGTGGNENHGVRIAGTDTLVRSTSGNIQIDGLGGSGVQGGHVGVVIRDDAVVETMVDGDILINGTGAGTGAGADSGVIIGAGANTAVRTVNGNIQIEGTGSSAGGNNNYGVRLRGDAVISSSGTGNVTITGQGGDTAGSNNYGVFLQDGPSVSTSGGTLQITGDGGIGGTNGIGIRIEGTNASITTTGTGNITLDGTAGSGSIGVDIAATTTLQSVDGNISLQSNGNDTIRLASDINTAGGDININDALQLTGDVAMNTGAAPAGGNITFTGTVDSSGDGDTSDERNLTLTAGAGNVMFTGVVGGAADGALGDLVIVSAADVTAAAVTANNLTQQAGTGTTTLNGAVTLGNNLSFTGTALAVNQAVNADGVVTVTNAGLFTTAAAGDISADGGFTQNGTGGNSLAGDITTDGNNISFATAVELAGNISLNTGAGAGNISFTSTLDGTTADIENLTLSAGTGDILFAGAVGGDTRLGDVTINSVNNLAIDDDFLAGAFSITAAADRDIFVGNTGAGMHLSNTELGRIDASSLSISSLGTGVITIEATTAPDTSNFGILTLNGAGGVTVAANGTQLANAVDITGATTLAGDLTTVQGDIDFHSPVTVTGADVTAHAGTTTASALTFDNTITGDAGTEQLTLLGGSIQVDGAISNLATLDVGNGDTISLTVNNVTTSGAQSYQADTINLAGSNYQSTGSGSISFTGAVDLIGTGAISVQTAGAAGDDISFSGTIDDTDNDSELTLNAGADGNVSIAGAVGDSDALNSFTVSNAAAATLNSIETGAGGIDVTASVINLTGTDYVTAAGDVAFDGAVELRNDVAVNTGAGVGDITFTGTVDSDAGNTRDLTLTAGNGNVDLQNAVGGTGALSSFVVSTANDVNLQAVTTDNGEIRVGTDAATRIGGTLTLNGDLTSHDAGDAGNIGLFADNIRLAASVTLDSNAADPNDDGAITIATAAAGSLESVTAYVEGLTLDAGSQTANVSNATLTNLDHLYVTADSFSLGDITLGDGSNAAIAGLALSITTTNDLTLTDDISTAGQANAGGVDLTGVGGNIVLAGGGAVDPDTVTISTNAAGTDASIELGTVVSSAGLALTLDSGDANTTLAGSVGTDTDAIGTLTIDAGNMFIQDEVFATSIGITAVNNVTAEIGSNAGNQDITATTGDLTISAGGTLTLEDATGADRRTRLVTLDGDINLTVASLVIQGNDTTNAAQIVSSDALNITVAGDGNANLGDVFFVGAFTLTDGELDQISADSLSVTTTGAGQISLAGTTAGNTDGFGDLTLTGNGGVTIGSGGSAAALTNGLEVTGATTLAGDLSTIDSDIDFNSAVTVAADVTVSTGTGPGAITFAGTVDSRAGETNDLTVTAGTGDVTFTGAVGSTDRLDDLVVNSTGTTRFNSTVEAGTLLTNAGGTTELNGDVTTVGTQTYNNDVLIDADIVLQTSDSAVSFAGTVDSSAGETNDLTVTAGTGDVTFTGAVGSTDRLDDLVVNSTGTTRFNSTVEAGTLLTNAGGTTELNGDVTTVGTQTYNNDVLIDADIVLQTSDSAVSFAGTVDSSAGEMNDLTVTAGTGDVTFDGLVGDSEQLGAVLITAATNVTANGVRAASFTQNAGTGTTTLNTGAFGDGTAEALNTTGVVDITNEVIAVNDTVTAGGSIAMEASNGVLTLATDAHVTADDDINLAASDNISLGGNVTAVGNTVTINSSGGSIDGTGLITGDEVSLDSDTGIGSAGNRLNTAAGTLAARSSTSGGVFINQTGNVTLDTVNGVDNDSAAAYDLIGSGSINVDGDITAGTTLDLAAAGNITLNSVTLTSGSDMTLSVGSAGAATLDLGAADLDAGANTIQLSGGIGGLNTLIAQDLENTWVINGQDQGTLDNANISNNPAQFENFGNLTGAENNNDSFAFTNSGTAEITGTIDGRGGNNTLDWSSYDDAITVQLSSVATNGFNGSADNVDAFANINVVTGDNNHSNTLEGADINAIWNINEINGPQSGTYSDNPVTQTLTWNNFNDLTGGGQADEFNVTVSHTGNLSGGANGANVFNFLSTTGAVLTGNVTGGAGNDTFNFGVPGTPSATEGYTIAGGIDGGDGTNTLDFSGSRLEQLVTLSSDRSGTITGDGADVGTDLLDATDGFQNIDNLIGNNLGTLVGQNENTYWVITGTDAGYFTTGTLADALSDTNTTAFSNFSILGGNQQDVFIFQAGGEITNNIDGGSTSGGFQNFLLGSTGADVFDILGGNSVSIDVAGAGDLTELTNIHNIDASFTDGVTTFDGGGNTFNIDFDWDGNLRGGDGNDTFVFNGGTVAGTVSGGAGGDSNRLDYSSLAGPITVNLETSNASFVTGGFSDIQALTGSGNAGDQLIGANAPNQWSIDGSDTGDVNGFSFEAIANLIGGAGTDIFTLENGSSISGSINGGGGNNTIQGADDDTTFNITGLNAGNITGGAAVASFTSIQNLTGGAGNDNFVRIGAGNISGLIDGGGGNDTLDVSGTASPVTLTLGSGFINIENLVGSNDTLVGRSGVANEWDLTGVSSGTITTTIDGTVNFTGFNTVRSSSGGSNTFTANGNYNGTVNLLGTNNFWNYTAGQTLTTGNVTGTGSLTIGTPASGAGGNMTIGAGDLVLPNLTGLTGPLIIGGLVNPATTPLNGSQSVTVNTNILTVGTPVTTGGDIVLLAGQINLNTNVMNIGGDMNFVATGTDCIGCGPISGGSANGNIVVNQPITVNANSGVIIAAGGIQNANDLTLDFGGGPLQLAVSPAQQLTSTPNPLSNAQGIPLTSNTLGFINVLGLNVVELIVRFFNPALELFGLEEVSFIDVSLFDEDLTLFGVIGEGIALALAQCEEVDGCAPNITLEEIDAYVEAMDVRIEELERKVEDTADQAERSRLQEVLANFRTEREEFLAYRVELEQFLLGPLDEGALAGDFEEELPLDQFVERPPVDMDAVDALARILQTMNTRIGFLETLLALPERRAELADRAGINLTEERLRAIIENTRSAARFIENLIQRLFEGADAGDPDRARFYAETGEPQPDLPTVGYNAADLNLRAGMFPIDARWF